MTAKKILDNLEEFAKALESGSPIRVKQIVREETPDGPLHITRDKIMEQFTFFWRGPFSQWYPSKFVVDGVEYVNAEQYMMASKAMLFGDNNTLRKIMTSLSPKETKALGRDVTPFDQGKWNAVARDLVYKGNLAKFMQNKDLREKLFETKGTTLVEASPVDAVWGIHLAADDPKAFDRSTWQGKNWLGEVLTKVRNDMMEGKTTHEDFGWAT